MKTEDVRTLEKDISMYEALFKNSNELLFITVEKPDIFKAIIENRIQILEERPYPESILNEYVYINDNDVLERIKRIGVALEYFEAKGYEESREECDCGNHAEHDRQMNPENYNANGNELEKAPDWYGGSREDYDNYKNS